MSMYDKNHYNKNNRGGGSIAIGFDILCKRSVNLRMTPAVLAEANGLVKASFTKSGKIERGSSLGGKQGFCFLFLFWIHGI